MRHTFCTALFGFFLALAPFTDGAVARSFEFASPTGESESGSQGPPSGPLSEAITAQTPKFAGITDVYVASLFWPPYVGKSLPYGGVDAKILREAFAPFGIRVHIDYVPWPRALMMFEQGVVDMVFPEYPERGRMHENCLMSNAYKTTSLAIIESTAAPVTWATLDDLKVYRLGVVRGYLNTQELDEMIALGEISADVGVNDVINLRKVAARRIDGAVIDPEVYRYLIEHDPSLQPVLNMLQVNGHTLGQRTLHVCFQASARGHILHDHFNDYIAKNLDVLPLDDPPLPADARPAGQFHDGDHLRQ